MPSMLSKAGKALSGTPSRQGSGAAAGRASAISRLSMVTTTSSKKFSGGDLLSSPRFDPVMPGAVKGSTTKPRRGLVGFNCVPSVDLSRVNRR